MIMQSFEFKAKLWEWNNGVQVASWHFVSLPKKISEEIKDNYPFTGRGFGSVPVIVTIGRQTWKTSLFPSKELQQYILPVKKEIRTKEGLKDGDSAKVKIDIDF